MIRRILLVVFATWLAIAPVIAGSCAAECEKAQRMSALHLADPHAQAGHQGDVPDCHEMSKDGQQSGDSKSSTGAMAAGCLVAASVAMHTPIASLVIVDLSTTHDVSLLLPSTSFESFPPYKPPRA